MTDSINALLDVQLDDLADLPSFAVYPAGGHRVLATFGTKEIGGKASVVLDFTYRECIELADENDVAPNAGDTSGTMFMLGNEFGEGNLKKCAAPFGVALEEGNLGQIVEQVTDFECVIMTTVRTVTKDGETKEYLQVKEVIIE